MQQQASYWARNSGAAAAAAGGSPSPHPSSKLRTLFGAVSRMQQGAACALGASKCAGVTEGDGLRLLTISKPTNVQQTAHVGIGTQGARVVKEPTLYVPTLRGALTYSCARVVKKNLVLLASYSLTTYSLKVKY